MVESYIFNQAHGNIGVCLWRRVHASWLVHICSKCSLLKWGNSLRDPFNYYDAHFNITYRHGIDMYQLEINQHHNSCGWQYRSRLSLKQACNNLGEKWENNEDTCESLNSLAQWKEANQMALIWNNQLGNVQTKEMWHGLRQKEKEKGWRYGRV